MKKLFSKNFLLAILMLVASIVTTWSVKAQEFLRPDSLRFGDSAAYYQTTPYGPIYLDVTDSSANARVDTVKGYYITYLGDTVIGTWYNARTNAYDSVLIPGNGKTNTWKLNNTENPYAIKIVRTNDSSTVTMLQTKIVLYGVRKQYNSIMKSEGLYTLAEQFYKKKNINDGVGLMSYSMNYYRPKETRLYNNVRW